MAKIIDDKPRPTVKDRVNTTVGNMQGSQAWSSIFRPGSIFRHGYPDTPRNRTLAVLGNAFWHLHPVKVRRSGIRLSYTWCMGGLDVLPVPAADADRPAADVRPPADRRARLRRTSSRCASTVPFGRAAQPAPLVGAHHGAHGVPAHGAGLLRRRLPPAARVQLGGRRVLLVLTLLLSFTGYLLPWDQLAFWAITVGTNMGPTRCR